MILSDITFKRLSGSIAATRFPLVLTILFLHAYTCAQVTGHETYGRVLYPIALWLGETGVPVYFFISGLLLFYSTKTYVQQLTRRAETLLMPYLFWNSLVMVGYLAVFVIGHEVLIAGKSIAQYTLTDWLRAFWDRGRWDGGNGMPAMISLWYVRDLMIMYILSPLLYAVIRTTKLLLPLVCCYFWVTEHNIALTWQCMTMFSLGAFFPIDDINPIDLLTEHKLDIAGFFVLFGAADIICHEWFPTPFNAEIHRLSLITNTFFWLRLGLFLHNRGIYFTKLSETAFFIYCSHFPIMLAICSLLPKGDDVSDGALIVYYFLSVIITVAICLGLYWAAHRYLPLLLRVATGNRVR